MTTETLYFLRDVLNDMTLNVSTPDFRHRAQLVINALNELDSAIESSSATGGDSISRGLDGTSFYVNATDDAQLFPYGGSNQ